MLQVWLPRWLVFINVAAFCLFGVDKHRAQKRRWRIREATLLWSAALGGSLGALLGMRVFHHKTLHRRFSLGVPLLLVLQIAAALGGRMAGWW